MNDRFTKPSGNEAQLEDDSQDAAVETLKPVNSETSEPLIKS